MNARAQVLEAELKTVRAVALTADRDVARAALEREKELRIELHRIRESPPKKHTRPQ